jgi:hypothetical protein
MLSSSHMTFGAIKQSRIRSHVLEQHASCTTSFPAADAAHNTSCQHITSRHVLPIATETLLRHVPRCWLLTSSSRRRIGISMKTSETMEKSANESEVVEENDVRGRNRCLGVRSGLTSVVPSSSEHELASFLRPVSLCAIITENTRYSVKYC